MIRSEGYCNGKTYCRSGLPSEGGVPEIFINKRVEYSKPPRYSPEHAEVMNDLAQRFSYKGAVEAI